MPLCENHADTRNRWTANTTTCSDFRGDVPDCPIPALECMFKGGEAIELKLQDHIRVRGFPSWLTVVTGPKGSYREEHILAFLEATLEEWKPGREWRILLLDAYAPQQTDNVFRLAWSRGYVLVNLGGGTTGVVQTNDVDLHEHQRREYTQKEMAELVRLARLKPDRMPSAKREQCIDWMAEVWDNRKLHAQAALGYKYTGCRNALDGSEDHLICREAGFFWGKLEMKEQRTKAMLDVEVEVKEERLKWGYDAVKSLIVPYPHRGMLDVTVEFQEDEVVVEEEGEDPWEEWKSEPEDDSDNDDNDDNDDNGIEEPHAHPTRDGGGSALTVEQADMVSEQSSRITALKQSIEALEAQGLSVAAQGLKRALKAEERKSMGTRAADAVVAKAMQESQWEEDRKLAKERQRVRNQMEDERLAKKAKTEARTMQKEATAARRKLQDAKEMQETQEALKTFTPEMLGAGKPRAGGADMKKRRKEVLQRLAAKGAKFSARGRNDWIWFLDAWDDRMINEHGAEWGNVFAGYMQHLAQELVAGNANAVINFMQTETSRVLSDVRALQV